jgi:predicted ATPase
VDAEAFEEAAKSARRSLDPAAYGAALELYAGELLPEERYEEWAEGRRRELGQLRLALLVGLAGLCEERGEYERGIEALRRVLREEPAREEAHASLMRLYALSGRRQEAILQYEGLRESLFRELDTEPAVESTRLYEEIRTGNFPATPSPYKSAPSEVSADSGRHNLPSILTSFVGRQREMVEAGRLLAMGRLLTLIGAGGSGKTRLALEIARGLVGTYPDGAWLVELAPVSEPELVPRAVSLAVAKAVEARERPGETLLKTLVDALGDKEMLLVLDNCEHLVEAAARTAEALLHSCPRLRVLATSRESLGIRGEVLWQVRPLSLPDAARVATDKETTVEGLMRSEAVRLFVDRARLKLPDFALTEENAPDVAAVCRKLDGIPLAIELATARIGSLAVEQVAKRLDASLDFLKGASRTAEARQRTLRATIDWGHDLLTGVERAFFRRLSAFSGGWTLEAAEAVCAGGDIGWEDVLDLLSGLVDKSLVVAGTGTGGAVRYRMLEPIRRYATEKLEHGEEAAEVKDRHAAFFLALAEEAEPELEGPRQGAWSDRLEGEHDNLRAALSWLLTRERSEPALRMGAALWRFWFTRGHLSEGTGWLERVLAEGEPEPSPARLKALEGLGWLLQNQGEYAQARASYEEMLELSRAIGRQGERDDRPQQSGHGGGAAGRPQAREDIPAGEPRDARGTREGRRGHRDDAQEVPRAQPARNTGDHRGGRLRTGDNPLGGGTGVGPGGRGHASGQEHPLEPRVRRGGPGKPRQGEGALRRGPRARPRARRRGRSERCLCLGQPGPRRAGAGRLRAGEAALRRGAVARPGCGQKAAGHRHPGGDGQPGGDRGGSHPGGTPLGGRGGGARDHGHRPVARRAGHARSLPGAGPFRAGGGGVGRRAGRGTRDVARRGRRIRSLQGSARGHH